MLLDDSLLLSDYKAYQAAKNLRLSSIKVCACYLTAASRWLIESRHATLSSASPMDLTA